MNHLNPSFEPAGSLVARYTQSVSFLILLATVMYCLMWGVADYQEFCSKPITYQAVPERSTKELAKRMRYHGTGFAYTVDGERTWFFERDNQECKLFGRKVKK